MVKCYKLKSMRIFPNHIFHDPDLEFEDNTYQKGISMINSYEISKKKANTYWFDIHINIQNLNKFS